MFPTHQAQRIYIGCGRDNNCPFQVLKIHVCCYINHREIAKLSDVEGDDHIQKHLPLPPPSAESEITELLHYQCPSQVFPQKGRDLLPKSMLTLFFNVIMCQHLISKRECRLHPGKKNLYKVKHSNLNPKLKLFFPMPYVKADMPGGPRNTGIIADWNGSNLMTNNGMSLDIKFLYVHILHRVWGKEL